MAEQVRNVDEINSQLAQLSALIYPEGLVLMYLHIDQINEQDLNAQSMPQKMLDQLTENIKVSGAVESVPLCAKVDGEVFMVSGHHRLRAARAAGLTHVLVLIYTQISKSRVRSKQLAHNSITGKSDPEQVKRIWQQITEIQAKFEAFIDPRVLNAMPPPVSFKQIDVNMQSRAKAVLVMFLPSQKTDFDATLEAILPKAEIDAVYIANRESFEGWKESLQRVKSDMEIVNLATALAEMARLAMQALDARQAQEPDSDQPAR